jgi:hypothetical protein
MAIYDRMKSVMDRLTAAPKFGVQDVLTISIPATSEPYNVANGSVSGSPTVLTIQGIDGRYNSHETDGTIIRQDDVKLITPRLTTTPTVGSEVTLHSKKYRVMNVKKIVVQGQDIGYHLQLRV